MIALCIWKYYLTLFVKQAGSQGMRSPTKLYMLDAQTNTYDPEQTTVTKDTERRCRKRKNRNPGIHTLRIIYLPNSFPSFRNKLSLHSFRNKLRAASPLPGKITIHHTTANKCYCAVIGHYNVLRSRESAINEALYPSYTILIPMNRSLWAARVPRGRASITCGNSEHSLLQDRSAYP